MIDLGQALLLNWRKQLSPPSQSTRTASGACVHVYLCVCVYTYYTHRHTDTYRQVDIDTYLKKGSNKNTKLCLHCGSRIRQC